MRTAALVCATWLLGALPARATPTDLFGYGARSSALGMTGVATSHDAGATFVNPARLGLVRQRGVWIGAEAAAFRVTLDGARFRLESSRGMLASIALPLPLGGPLDEMLTLGLAFYTPAKVLLEGTVSFPEVPQFPVLGGSQAVAVHAGLGANLDRLVPGLAVGLGTNALADLVGSVRVRLDETQTFVSQTETQLLTSPSLVVGASYTRGAHAFGVVFRDEVRSEMSLGIEARGLPIQIPRLAIGGLVQYAPPTIAAEASWRPAEDWLLVLHGAARLWAAWPGIQQATGRSSRLAPDPDFATVISPRVAIERTLRRHGVTAHLRGGYAFEPTPAPPARIAPRRFANGRTLTARGEPHTAPLRYLDNHRHVWTGGLGVELPTGSRETVHLDLFGQLHWLSPRTHVIGATQDAPPMRTGGAVWVGGWTAGITW